jgi:peptidyl-prolyl cis-trans isomerase D
MTLVRRARGGEDFSQLAKDYSEGPAADKGGVIDRPLQPSDFDPTIGAKVGALTPGEILDPFQDQSRFVILKRLPPDSTTTPGSLRLAQIVVRVRASDTELRDQYDQLKKLRDEAKRNGLGKAASAHGLATSSTGPYDANTTPQQLYPTPEAADWGLNAKVHDVSPVYEGPDEFNIVQVTKQSEAGVPPRSEVEPALRQLAELEKRNEKAKAKADAFANSLHSGATLEAAAAANGLTPITLKGVTRAQPDPRIANLPEVIGTLFGSKPGKIDGPIETVNGWYFTRVDQSTPADPSALAAMRTQVIGQILQRRQQAFMASYLNEIRRKAKIQDLRTELGD